MKKIKQIGYFSEGFAYVEFEDGSWNFIDEANNVLSEVDFSTVSAFSDGLAIVKFLNGKWSVIDAKGRLVSRTGYDWIGFFSEGIAPIYSHQKSAYNFVDQNGTILFEEWHDSVKAFRQGKAAVRKKRKGWNYIDREGRYVSKIWFSSADSFFSEGFAMVSSKEDEKKWNAINESGKLLFREWRESYKETLEQARVVVSINNLLNDDEMRRA